MRYLILITALLLLQSCQQQEMSTHSSMEQRHQTDAALFNTELGLAYLNQGDRPRAKRKLLLALKEAPNLPTVNAAMAYFMEKTGDVERANKYYRKALQVAPRSGAQLNNYGAFLCRQGQYQQAEPYFLKAVNDIHYEHSAAAYENAGLCAMAIPDDIKAITYFNKALEQDPSRKQALYEGVTIEMKQGQANLALRRLQKYLNNLSCDPVLLVLAVKVAKKAGDFKLAAEYNTRLSSCSTRRSAAVGGIK